MRILRALYYCGIHSLDELAKKPDLNLKKLSTRRGIGAKTLERIRAALASQGIMPDIEDEPRGRL
jgi:DNA-binding IscR family transcriptional regulator